MVGGEAVMASASDAAAKARTLVRYSEGATSRADTKHTLSADPNTMKPAQHSEWSAASATAPAASSAAAGSANGACEGISDGNGHNTTAVAAAAASRPIKRVKSAHDISPARDASVVPDSNRAPAMILTAQSTTHGAASAASAASAADLRESESGAGIAQDMSDVPEWAVNFGCAPIELFECPM